MNRLRGVVKFKTRLNVHQKTGALITVYTFLGNTMAVLLSVRVY